MIPGGGRIEHQAVPAEIETGNKRFQLYNKDLMRRLARDSVCTPTENMLSHPRIRTREPRLNMKQEQNTSSVNRAQIRRNQEGKNEQHKLDAKIDFVH
jgi:hypothetical protein